MLEANQGADLNKPYFTGGQTEVRRILRVEARIPVSRWGSFSVNLRGLLSSSNTHEFQTLPINGPKRAGPGPFLLAFPGHAAPSYPLPAGFPGGSIRRLQGVGAARIPVPASALPHFGAILGNPSGGSRALCGSSLSPPLSEPGLAWLLNEGADSTAPAVSSRLKGETLARPRLPEEEGCPDRPPPWPRAPGPHIPGCSRATTWRSSGPAHPRLR